MIDDGDGERERIVEGRKGQGGWYRETGEWKGCENGGRYRIGDGGI